ncbi:unnamed protein product, partial [marine sediment metagenome]
MGNKHEEGTMLDLKEERRYTRLKKLARELHIPMPEAFITLEVFDKDGKLIQRHHQRSHSWARNAYNMMFASLAGVTSPDATWEAGKLSQKFTNGSIESGDYPFAMYFGKGASPYGYKMNTTDVGYRAAATEDSKGILVGSGENAESFEDYVLQTPIVEGTGANQLNHIESQPHSVSYA